MPHTTQEWLMELLQTSETISYCCPTLNDLPKTSLIWRASVRLPEMLRKIMTVYCAVQDCALVRLRAEDQVFVLSGGETPHDATVSDFPDIGVRVSLSNKRRSV